MKPRLLALLHAAVLAAVEARWFERLAEWAFEDDDRKDAA